MRKVPSKATLANMVFRVLLCNWLIAALAFGATAAPAGQPLRIVVLGDSLVAGFGLKPSDAFPAQLERARLAGADSVLVKPCLPERLQSEMQRVIEESRS